MGSATEVARESADAVLLGNDLVKMHRGFGDLTVDPEEDHLGELRGYHRPVDLVESYWLPSVSYVLAALGQLRPTLAVFIPSASEMTFILNRRGFSRARNEFGRRTQPVWTRWDHAAANAA